jgi:electron transfer flavoprotein alpha subunit
MEKILYIAHTEADYSLSKAALEALSGALELTAKLDGATLTVGLVGEDISSAANAIAGCGAEKILGVSGADYATSRYGSDAAAIVEIAKAAGATLILAPATSRFSRAMPGATHRLGGSIDTHISGLDAADGGVQVQRWFYRQRMMADMTRTERPWALLIDPGVFMPWQGEAGTASVEAVAVQLPDDCGKTSVTGYESPAVDAQTIRPEADLLFVAGAGWTKKQADGQTHLKDAEKLILGFLEASQASLGSSKSLVDQSSDGEAVLTCMSHLNQVGQTGSTPRHPKGLASCCHGEEPHVVGWRFINDRRAINTDPNCGWAQGKADVLYVADAFEVMEKVNQLLSEG